MPETNLVPGENEAPKYCWSVRDPSGWLWANIDSPRAARNAVRRAAWFALIAPVASVIAVILAAQYSVVPEIILFGAVNCVLAFFMFKMSRLAAVLNLLFYAKGVVFQVLAHGPSSATAYWLFKLLIVLLYISAVRGSFAYRRLTSDLTRESTITELAQ